MSFELSFSKLSWYRTKNFCPPKNEKGYADEKKIILCSLHSYLNHETADTGFWYVNVEKMVMFDQRHEQ